MLLGWGLIHVASTFGVLTSRYRGIRVRAEHDNHALLVHISAKEERRRDDPRAGPSTRARSMTAQRHRRTADAARDALYNIPGWRHVGRTARVRLDARGSRGSRRRVQNSHSPTQTRPESRPVSCTDAG